MLCLRCEALGDRPVVRSRWSGAERLKGMLCGRCGAVLPAPDQGGRLLDKLAQLARFGLVADATLLTTSHKEG